MCSSTGTFRKRGSVSLKCTLLLLKSAIASSLGRLSTSARRMGKSNENPLWATRTALCEFMKSKKGSTCNGYTRVVKGVRLITNIWCCGNNPVHEEGKYNREGPFTSKHGGVDTCNLGNLYRDIIAKMLCRHRVNHAIPLLLKSWMVALLREVRLLVN